MTQDLTNKLEEIFDLNYQNSANIGGSIFDLNPLVGYDPTVMSSNTVIDKSPSNILNAYSSLLQLETKEECDKLLILARLWCNGFSIVKSTFQRPKGSSQEIQDFFTKKGFLIISQRGSAQPPDRLSCLFSCFKWFNSNNKIIEEFGFEKQKEEGNNFFISNGLRRLR